MFLQDVIRNKDFISILLKKKRGLHFSVLFFGWFLHSRPLKSIAGILYCLRLEPAFRHVWPETQYTHRAFGLMLRVPVTSIRGPGFDPSCIPESSFLLMRPLAGSCGDSRLGLLSPGWLPGCWLWHQLGIISGIWGANQKIGNLCLYQCLSLSASQK